MPAAKNNPDQRPPRAYPRPATAKPAEPQELVDPRWLAKALGLTAMVGIFCAWLLLCIVFYKIQWQFVLHPSHEITKTPASFGLSFEEVNFGTNATGQPQINGWWIPVNPSSGTVLVLHDGKGDMSDALASAQMLHDLQLNVLLIDYRGYGKSADVKPNQANMNVDAESALSYLRDQGRLQHGGTYAYGIGLGAAVATELASKESAISAVILEAPNGDVESQVARDPRTRLIPVHMLFHENFPLAAPLAQLHTPKLLIAYSGGNTPQLFQQAADPKMTVELPSQQNTAAIESSIRRFLDTYTTTQPSTLTPNTAR